MWRRRLCYAVEFPRRGSHEIGADWIADVFAENGVDCSAVAFREGPTADFVDGRELFRMTRARERDTNTGLIE
jgi:hypothetical protein